MSEKVKYGKKPVATLSRGVRTLLRTEFGDIVKESIEGFRVNIQELNWEQVHCLGRLQIFQARVTIKRSGTGLVIFIK